MIQANVLEYIFENMNVHEEQKQEYRLENVGE